MDKWPEGTRFFEVQKDKRNVIDELFAKGDIEALCGSETGECFCIATNGCTTTLKEVKAFAADWFGKDEDAWWFCELPENDATTSYDMDYTPKRRIFTENDQDRTGRNDFALFLYSDDARGVTAESGLSLKKACSRYFALAAPGCGKFITEERAFYNADVFDLFDLFIKRRCFWRHKSVAVLTGTLPDLIAHTKNCAIKKPGYWLIAPHKEAAENA